MAIITRRKDPKGKVLKEGERYRKSDKRYEYRYRQYGVQKSLFAKTLEELRQKEAAFKKDIDDGISTDINMTLNDAFDKYFETKLGLKETTRSSYKYAYDHFVRDTLGRKPIKTIKKSTIKGFYVELMVKKGMSPATIDNIHTLLHPTFRLMVDDDIIRKNPASSVMKEIRSEFDWRQEPRHALTTDEQKAFMDYVRSNKIYKHWLLMFTVFLGTGLRVGELLGLRWCDVDFENNEISVNHSLAYKPDEVTRKSEHHITEPKTKNSVRTIPMMENVRDMLLAEQERQRTEHDYCTSVIDGYSGFIFLNRFKTVFQPGTVNRAIRRIVRDYQLQEDKIAAEEGREALTIRPFSVHNFRHTFCTRLCEADVNIKVIQSVMGHSDIQTTLDIYSEATKQKKQASLAEVEGKVLLV